MLEELDIGNNIKELREKMGLNQRAFAENIGIFSADYLRKVERGELKEPKYNYLIAIANVCEVSVDYILTGIGAPENQNMNMQTESAKEAIKHLNKCADSIKKLDDEAFPAIQALEDAVSKHEDPETRKMMAMINSSNMANA